MYCQSILQAKDGRKLRAFELFSTRYLVEYVIFGWKKDIPPKFKRRNKLIYL